MVGDFSKNFMVGAPRGKTGLQSLSIRRLRELARSLRVHLFSRLSRTDLIQAIDRRAPGGAAADEAPPEAPPQLESTPAPAAAPLPQATSWLQLEAIDTPWVQLRWQLNSADRLRLQQEAGDRLRLRLADITDRGHDDTPQTQLEVQPDAGVAEWQLALPLLGRLYRAELGFRHAADDSWVTLALSSPLWVAPAAEGVASPAPAAAPDLAVFPVGTWVPTGVPAIHERLYQTATALQRRRSMGASEELQEHGFDRQALAAGAGEEGFSASAAGLSAPGLWASGLWESGRSASGQGGLPPRQRRFWLVADAELIVYGATDPAARLTIGDEEVPLSVDGTFHRHVPFPDGEQEWPIAAVAADGEQRRSITLSFERRTPEARVNTAEEAQDEWF